PLGGARVDVDDVGASGGLEVDGRSGVLVGGSAADREDLPDVVHDGVAIHRVSARAAPSRALDGAAAGGGDPVHLPAGAGLENGAASLGEQPGMVVGAIDAAWVCGKYLAGQHTAQLAPATGCAVWGEYLPVLVAGQVLPGAAEGEHLSV